MNELVRVIFDDMGLWRAEYSNERRSLSIAMSKIEFHVH
jgi:hypothetical protein